MIIKKTTKIYFIFSLLSQILMPRMSIATQADSTSSSICLGWTATIACVHKDEPHQPVPNFIQVDLIAGPLGWSCNIPVHGSHIPSISASAVPQLRGNSEDKPPRIYNLNNIIATRERLNEACQIANPGVPSMAGPVNSDYCRNNLNNKQLWWYADQLELCYIMKRK